ncbi:hypothetical protein A2Y99_02305 [Candidatus Gottesmanbacteria bacterium RBG_13_37_7]|uniref:Fibronectin type-III domain-containing protein n=1 Tax=Candidatus Gottesmanbacteria bacterium RBG_13_37_7 TaxID=1798369 RepID=A0A1F5YJ95_9BACT|nr:MAG: hypothetical protein A2Y99_02305 [Candidatus Gottesmanbacteria bacterium RBG_13_37_7]
MKKSVFQISIFILPLILLGVAVGQVQAEPYGWSPSTDNSGGGAPQCTETYTQQAVLYEPNHWLLPKAQNRGEIRLWWHPTTEASNYNIYYGLTPGNYIYAVANVGSNQTNNYTVQYLQNKKYYFAIQANKGCGAGPISNEWMGRPPRGGYVASLAVR